MSQRSDPLSSFPSTGNDVDDPDLILKTATAYIDRGWRVFPLHSISPAGLCTCGSRSCWQKGNHAIRPAGMRGATTRLRDVLDWWEDDPDANIGIVTGSGLLVIAVCPERHGTLEALHLNPIPHTGLVTTGDGGWHLYFRYNKVLFLESRKDALGPGIDILAEGSYVVAPPSLHASGRYYAWTSYIAPRLLPPKILAMLQPEQGWVRSDYRSVLDLMSRCATPLSPMEVSNHLHKDYSATCKMLRRMVAEGQLSLVKRGLYAPAEMPERRNAGM